MINDPPTTSISPGRSCPVRYRYGAASLARPAEAQCETLYVVGGLYGNDVALDAVLRMFDAERAPKRLVFNGDFHWFDSDPAVFARVQRRVLGFDALRGNVETELGDPGDPGEPGDPLATDETGCGCAYPDWVGDSVVQRSNRILDTLRRTALLCPGAPEQLAALDMTRRVDVAGVRVGIVHGDAESLAGWGFAAEHLRDEAHRQQARAWFDIAQVDLFACSHTCLPVFCSLPQAGDAPSRFTPAVLNNGAAGMGNFRGDSSGLLTRISSHAVPAANKAQLRHGLQRGGLHIDALAIAIPPERWHPRFLAQWPAGTDAHASYWQRICEGPDHGLDDALSGQAPP
jgi:hypothetical protein